MAKEKYRATIQYEKFIEKKGNSFHVHNHETLFTANLDELGEKYFDKKQVKQDDFVRYVYGLKLPSKSGLQNYLVENLDGIVYLLLKCA